jgi:hypothetical protein
LPLGQGVLPAQRALWERDELQGELFRVSLQEQDGLQDEWFLVSLPGRRALREQAGLRGVWFPVWLREPDESSFQDERPERHALPGLDALRGEWLPALLRDGRLFRAELRLDVLPVRDAPLLHVPRLRCGSVPLRC